MSKFSVNNHLILRPYKTDGALKSEVRNGFALVDQKVSLKGLELLMDAHTEKYGQIPKGAIVYFKEADLHTQPWAKQFFKCDGIEGLVSIIDIGYAEFVEIQEPKEIGC